MGLLNHSTKIRKPNPDCEICIHNRDNGGMDCDPEPEDYNDPCEAFEPMDGGFNGME